MSITFYESNNNRQERAARAQIKGREQAILNAREWVRRANVAARERNMDVDYFHILDAARCELRPYGLGIDNVL